MNPINNPVNVTKGFLMSKQVEYIGLVTIVIECRVLNMTEEATYIFKNGAKIKIEKQFRSLTHSLTHHKITLKQSTYLNSRSNYT